MDINWSKAPDWAVAHGLHETGFGIKEFWLGETQHQNLEHAKSFPYGGGDPSCGSFHNSRRESFSYVTPRPAPWTGEGLPPVGTVCEHHKLIPGEEWTQVEIVAHRTFDGDDYPCAVFVYSQSSSHSSSGDHFRPCRTPEQIAADEREKAIQKMLTACPYPGSHDGVARPYIEALYDAGYRKQPLP